jgi:DnaJ-class molecular chaperone
MTDAGQDMSGLVRMIHAAYEVLSNSESRRRYDAELARDAAMADAELKATLDQQANARVRPIQEPPAGLKSAVAALAA